MHRTLISSAAGACLLACGSPLSDGLPESRPVQVAPPLSLSGSERLFLQAGCGGCHTLDGLPGATGIAGPNLTNIGLRPTLAGETIANDRDTFVRWLLDPATVKPDARMPSVGLTQQEAGDLADFLIGRPNARP